MYCVEDRNFLDGVRVYDWDVRIVLVKSGFISRGSSPSSDVYDTALDLARAWRTE